jgi:transposase
MRRREILTVDRQLHEQHKATPLSQRLAAIPGVGPIIAMTMALSINATTSRMAVTSLRGWD